MNCKNCIGSGIVAGFGEYRGVCPICDGLGREIVIKSHKNKQAKSTVKKKLITN